MEDGVNGAESVGLHKMIDVVVGDVNNYHTDQVGRSSGHLEACKHLVVEDTHLVVAFHVVMAGVVQCVPWATVEDDTRLSRLEDGEDIEWREGYRLRWLDLEGPQNRGQTSVRNPSLFVERYNKRM